MKGKKGEGNDVTKGRDVEKKRGRQNIEGDVIGKGGKVATQETEHEGDRNVGIVGRGKWEHERQHEKGID